MIRRHRRDQQGSDTGATLILVLILIFTVSITSVAILRLSYTTLRAAATTSGVAEAQYDEQNAMQTQINNIRTSDYDNDINAGQQCPPTQTVGANTGGQFVTTCIPLEDSGAASGGTSNNANNTPYSALLTLGEGAGGESGIQRTGNGYLSINGQTYSRSTIVNTTGATNAIELTAGQAFARGACTGVITSAPAVACNTVLNPNGSTDPGYTQPTPDGGTLLPATLPTCGDDPDVLELNPGYYDDGAALTTLFAACPTRMFWFKPGKYFFDFKNGQSRWKTGTPIWTIASANTRMVAGTPKDWSSTDSNPQPSFPGACKAPTEQANNGGVSFVFGGRSQMLVSNGSVEICGTYSNSKPATGVFGATTQYPASLPDMPQMGVPNSPATNGGCTVPMAGLSNLTYADSSYATATVGQNQNSCVDMTGFGASQVIPKGSTLVDATLIVRYGVTGGAGNMTTGSFTVTPKKANGDPGADVVVTTTAPSTTMTYRFATLLGTSALSDFVRDGGYSGADIRYVQAKTTANSRTLQTDTVQLVLNWIPPSVIPQSQSPITTYSTSSTHNITAPVQTDSGGGTSDQVVTGPGAITATTINCVQNTPYTGTISTTVCPFIAVTGTGNAPSNTKFFVRGTLYAPSAALDLRQHSINAPVVDVGTIVRKLRLVAPTTTARATAIFATQPFSPPNVPLEVYAWTFRCTTNDAGLCYLDPIQSQPGYPYVQGALWTLVGTTRVKYTNGSGFPDAVGDRDVNVMSWQNVAPYERP